jgi:hypothetical protein
MDEGAIDIRRLLEAEIGDVYVELGARLPARLGLLPSRRELMRDAKLWMSSKRAELAEILCRNESLRRLSSRRPTVQNRILLVTAIMDLITSVVTGVAAATVAVLLVREGLSSLCADSWGREG